MNKRILLSTALAFTAFALVGCATPQTAVTPTSTPTSSAPAGGDPRLAKIEHIVVIYAENRSFDNLYGLYPGADGIAQARPSTYLQRDNQGRVLPHLPPVWKSGSHGAAPAAPEPDPAFPANLPNKPFRIDDPHGANMGLDQPTRDLVHLFYQHKEQINGGRLDRFAAVSNAGGLVMGHYDGSKLPMWKIAQEYTLADHFFMGAFGGSFLNHMWLACACTPVFPDAPAKMRATVDPAGALTRKPGSELNPLKGPAEYTASTVSPDGYAVNTSQSTYQPSGIPPAPGGDPQLADPSKDPLPPQTFATIGDRLSDKNVSWAWYSGAFRRALADSTNEKREVIYNGEEGSPNFQPHHQPYNYFANYAPGTKAREEHLKDLSDLEAAIDAGNLPSVAFYKPQGSLNQHPGYTDVLSGDEHIAQLVRKIEASPQFASTVVIVTYDENGGFWDHVAPPRGDRWGPGSRIPAIIVSPFAKRGHVDHTLYDTTSILKFITRRFDLKPLPGVRENMGDLTNALDLKKTGVK